MGLIPLVSQSIQLALLNKTVDLFSIFDLYV